MVKTSKFNLAEYLLSQNPSPGLGVDKIRLADSESCFVHIGPSLNTIHERYDEQTAHHSPLSALIETQNEDLLASLLGEQPDIEAPRRQQPTGQGKSKENQSEKSLSTKERESLLTLVISMAVGGYRYDPRQSRNAATRDIQDDIEALGLSLDGDTIRKFLRQGAERISLDALGEPIGKPNSAKR